MRRREVAQAQAEYLAKITDDNGMARGRVPHPILHALKARTGDYMIFRLGEKGEAILRVTRSKMKSGRGNRRKSASRKTASRQSR